MVSRNGNRIEQGRFLDVEMKLSIAGNLFPDMETRGGPFGRLIHVRQNETKGRGAAEHDGKRVRVRKEAIRAWIGGVNDLW